MKAIFKILFITLLFTSCGGSRAIDESAMNDVEVMMSAKDFEAAQSVCDDMIEGKDLNQIPIKDLCRLSILYSKLSEQQNQEDNMATATKCYRAARALNADSVAKYFSGLPTEDFQYAELLKNLSNLMDSPMEIRDGEPCDSVTPEATHNHDHNNEADDIKTSKEKNKVSKKESKQSQSNKKK